CTSCRASRWVRTDGRAPSCPGSGWWCRARAGCPARACGADAGSDRGGSSAPWTARLVQGVVEAGDVVGHHHQIAGAARVVDHEVLEQRLGPEAEPLEGAHRPFLVRGHLGHDLAEPAATGEGEDLAGQRAPEPLRAEAQRDLGADLAQVPLPRHPVLPQRRVTRDGAARLRDDGGREPRLEIVHPVGDRLGIGDVHAEEEQVVFGQAARERGDRQGVPRGHEAQHHRRAVLELDGAREDGRRGRLHGAHGERSIEAMDVLVETRRGRVRGQSEGGLAIFRGTPYARPPVGPRRFAPPEPPEAWAGTRDATRFGPSAPQNGALIGPIMSLGIGRTDEDCLYLNVWTPAADGRQRPVLVWIHGGAFLLGSGSQMLYDGAALARRGDVVVVTINYRL